MPKRITWMVVGGALTLVARSRAEQAVDDEARRLAPWVPIPDGARMAATVVVAGRTAVTGGRMGYRAAVVGGRGAAAALSAATVAGRLVADGVAAGHDLARRLRDDVDATRATWRDAADQEERLLRADLALLDGDPGGAIDALVDRRRGRPAPASAPATAPAVPPPVAAGRARAAAVAPRPRPPRAQRTYHRP